MRNEEKIYYIIDSIENSLNSHNYFAAISSALILIDVCGSLEFKEGNNKINYFNWTEKYLTPILTSEPGGALYLNKENIYYLRCALLHQASTDPTTQKSYSKNVFLRVRDLIPMINTENDMNIIVLEVENPPKKNSGNVEGINDTDPTVFVDVRFLSKCIVQATKNWLVEKREDDIFKSKELDIFSVAFVGRRKDNPNKIVLFREK